MALCIKCSKELAFNDLCVYTVFQRNLKSPKKLYMKKSIFLKSTDARFLIKLKQRRMWSDKTYTAPLISGKIKAN